MTGGAAPTIVPFGSALYREALAFRDEHLRRPLGLAQDAADLAGEAEQIHLALLEGGRVRGTAVLKPGQGGTVKLRQMAIDPALRGTGEGRRLMGFAEAVARDRGFARIELHARLTARPFYERLGYGVTGPAFIEVTLPHVAMARDI